MRPAVVVTVCLLVAASSWSLFARDTEENYRWDEAVKFVDSLPFSGRVLDSLKMAYHVSFPATPLRVEPDRDFFKAETLVYDIGWGPFKAGYVVLTAAPDTATHTIKLGGKGLSNGFVTTFYRMRDYVISTIDARGLYPLFFEQHLREGKRYRRDGWILFDHQKKTIYVKERKVTTLESPAFVNDFLSVLYLARMRKYGPGDTFSLPLYADGKVHSLAIICKERQTLNFNGARTSTLLVEPKLVGDKGAFNKKGSLDIWLTDDNLKIPVQIKSKISIGAVTAKLLYSNKPGFLSPASSAVADTGKKRDTTAIIDPKDSIAR
jgi:hypothetical protein